MQATIERYEATIKQQSLLIMAKQCIEEARAIDDFSTDITAKQVVEMLDTCIGGSTCEQCDLESALMRL